MQNGHVCLELERLCRGELPIEAADGPVTLAWPELDAWLDALRASPLVGDEHAVTPLCLGDHGRLYLRRYFEHERSLLSRACERAPARAAPAVDASALARGLDHWFPRAAYRCCSRAPRRPTRQLDLFAALEPPPARLQPQRDAPDLQRLAAERAVLRALCVISGGPGTGKTATVVKILALLVEQARALQPASAARAPARPDRQGRSAPERSDPPREGRACRAELRDAIAENASTIHRALGTLGFGNPRFRHNRETPLATDVVVVDEASMVDLALMARLLDAVPTHARVILLGDRNQLASVEAGAVLGDICGTGLARSAPAPAIADCIVQLTRSYRYTPESGIRQLADAINEADAARALALLSDPSLPDIQLVDTSGDDALPEALLTSAISALRPFFAAADARDKLRALDRFRVLCAHRRGAHGQVAVNAAIEARLRAAGILTTSSDRYAGPADPDHQERPASAPVQRRHRRAARGPEQPGAPARALRGADDRARDIAAARLPPHESVYAMSVHKSQGSEFDEIAVLLPPEASPVLSRELLYTAVTRAKQRVVVYASPQVIEYTVQKAVQRASGLRDALWGRESVREERARDARGDQAAVPRVFPSTLPSTQPAARSSSSTTLVDRSGPRAPQRSRVNHGRRSDRPASRQKYVEQPQRDRRDVTGRGFEEGILHAPLGVVEEVKFAAQQEPQATAQAQDVGCAHDRASARPQHAVQLAQQQVRVLEVLDDLERDHGVERLVRERQAAVEIDRPRARRRRLETAAR